MFARGIPPVHSMRNGKKECMYSSKFVLSPAAVFCLGFAQVNRSTVLLSLDSAESGLHVNCPCSAGIEATVATDPHLFVLDHHFSQRMDLQKLPNKLDVKTITAWPSVYVPQFAGRQDWDVPSSRSATEVHPD
jgi:hypothetical protein